MSLFSVFSVSASGMSAQRLRSEILVENIANAETTRTPEGGPYQRKDVVFTTSPQATPFESVFQQELGPTNVGVNVSEIVTDKRDPERRYIPGHPDADKDGYVAFPRMNPAEDMIDLMNASRQFQANVSAMQAAKDMISRSVDLLR